MTLKKEFDRRVHMVVVAVILLISLGIGTRCCALYPEQSLQDIGLHVFALFLCCAIGLCVKSDWLRMLQKMIYNTDSSEKTIRPMKRWILYLIPNLILFWGGLVACLCDTEGEGIAATPNIQIGILLLSVGFLMAASKREYNESIQTTIVSVFGTVAIVFLGAAFHSVFVGLELVIIILISDVIFQKDVTFESIMYAILPVFVGLLICVLTAGLLFHQDMTDIFIRTISTAETTDSAFLYVVAGKTGWGYKFLIVVHIALHVFGFSAMVHLSNFPYPSDRIQALGVVGHSYYYIVFINTISALFQDPTLLYIPEPYMSFITYVFLAFVLNAVLHIKLMTGDDMCYEEPGSEPALISLEDEDGLEKTFLLCDELYHYAHYCLLSPLDPDDDSEIEVFKLTPNEDETETYEKVLNKDLCDWIYRQHRLLTLLRLIPGVSGRIERFNRIKSEKAERIRPRRSNNDDQRNNESHT